MVENMAMVELYTEDGSYVTWTAEGRTIISRLKVTQRRSVEKE